MSIFYLGKPYEGKPHVRFDEGSRKTGLINALRPCPTLQESFVVNFAFVKRTEEKLRKQFQVYFREFIYKAQCLYELSSVSLLFKRKYL